MEFAHARKGVECSEEVVSNGHCGHRPTVGKWTVFTHSLFTPTLAAVDTIALVDIPDTRIVYLI